MKTINKFNLTKDELEAIVADDVEFSEQGWMTESARNTVGEDGVIGLMNRVNNEGTNFSWKKFDNFLQSQRSAMQRESGVSATGFAPYYRLGVQVLVTGGYKAAACPYNDLAAVKQSESLAKPYASAYRPTMPQKGFGGKKPKQISFQPRSLVVTNEDFASFYTLERKAIEDDQTSTFNRVVAQEGENYNVQRQIYFDSFLSGVANNKFGVSVPAPSYSDNDGLTGLYNSTRGNTFNSPQTLSETSIENALIQIGQMTQPGPEGQLILINPDVLYTSLKDKFNARRILQSESTPAINSSDTTNTTGYQSINPVKGELKPLVSAHLPSGSWYIMESKADSLIIQERHPLETAMENPESGNSFETRSFRYRWFMRWAMFWYEARYVFQGHS